MKTEDQEILDWIRSYFAGREAGKENLVAVLLAMQERFGYLSKTGMKEIASRMGLTPSNVFGVSTFYNQFRFVPPGKHPVKVCMGTACHIKRSTLILDHWERRLGIRVGQVTEDRQYSLDRVDCVGCCTLAPVSLVSDKVIGEMAVTKVDGILLQHKIQREREDAADGKTARGEEKK